MAILEVPSAHATIVAAQIAATDGDIINVAAGAYTETSAIGYVSGKSLTVRGDSGSERTEVIIRATPGNAYGFRPMSSGKTLTLENLTIEIDHTQSPVWACIFAAADTNISLSNVWVRIIDQGASQYIIRSDSGSLITAVNCKISSECGLVNLWKRFLQTTMTWDTCDFYDIRFWSYSNGGANTNLAGEHHFVDCTFSRVTETTGVIYIHFHDGTAAKEAITCTNTSFYGIEGKETYQSGFYRNDVTVDNDVITGCFFQHLAIAITIADYSGAEGTAENVRITNNTIEDCENVGVSCGTLRPVIQGNSFYHTSTFTPTEQFHAILPGSNARAHFTNKQGKGSIITGNYADIKSGYLLVDKGDDILFFGNYGILRGDAGAVFYIKGGNGGQYRGNVCVSNQRLLTVATWVGHTPEDWVVEDNLFVTEGGDYIVSDVDGVDMSQGTIGNNRYKGTPAVAFYNDSGIARDWSWWQANTNDSTSTYPDTDAWTDEGREKLLIHSFTSGKPYFPQMRIGSAGSWSGDGWRK